MRILVISFLPEEKFSSRQHLGFMKLLGKDNEYIRLPRDEISREDSAAREIYNTYKPDVVIHYDSCAPGGKEINFSPTFFTSFPCAKVMVEVDFWKKFAKVPRWGDLNWYVSNEFDLVIRRGCFRGMSKIGPVPSVWLPFSASEEFYPDNTIRQKKVGFAGAYKHKGIIGEANIGYEQRVKAMEILGEINLLEHCKTCRTLKGSIELYPQFLRSVRAALTSAENRSPYGKVFEIMASGTVLLTPDFDHKHALFGSKETFVEFDYDNLVEKTMRIMEDDEWADQIVSNARWVINRYHTREKRIKELNEHLNNLIAGKPIIHRWES